MPRSLTHIFVLLPLFLLLSCLPQRKHRLAIPEPVNRVTGSEFYRHAAAFNWRERDSIAVRQILSGNIPSFLKEFIRVDVSINDSAGNVIRGAYFVAPDYLSVGSDKDWARVPLTPMAAQQIADSFRCFLPTRKITDDIYRAATVKLEPVPMFAFRDSTPTMWHHHLVIEGLRRNRNGLIAGIKKDVVISGKLTRDPKPNRVAIYGWHRLDGKPIQPLYTGHVNWYVDYSHGARLVHRTILVEGNPMDYIEVMQHPVYHRLLCDEEHCDVYRY